MMMDKRILIYSVIILLLLIAINFTKLIAMFLIPYLLGSLYILSRHYLLNKKITKESLMNYGFFMSLIFTTQALFIHYYWNKLDVEFSKMFKINETMQSVEIYKEFLYRMDEVISHKILFFSFLLTLLILISYFYANRKKLKKEKIYLLINNPLAIFMASFSGILSFFLSVEALTLIETTVTLSVLYVLLLLYWKRSEKLIIIKPIYEIYYFSFLSLLLLKIVLIGF